MNKTYGKAYGGMTGEDYDEFLSDTEGLPWVREVASNDNDDDDDDEYDDD